MPYPAALGQRPLAVGEAYAALAQYASDYGRQSLLLLMHASVAETLRADLLDLIRVNFLGASAGDASIDADVLFSPLCSTLGGGYYRIDAQVRWHALALLRSLYRDDAQARERRVAELLWRYVEAMEKQASRGADPRLAEFLAIQRWVALAFLEPASAAHAFAEALRQAGDAPQTSALLRLGGVTSAIELPLANEQELLAYARGLDALVSGDDERARTLLRALGDNEIRVGDVVLRSPASWLEGVPSPATAGEATDEAGASARRKLCVLLAGSAPAPALAAMIGEAVAAFDMTVVGRDDLRTRDPAGRVLYERLLDAELVVCDLSPGDPEDFYLLGVCWALRPSATLVVAEQRDVESGPPSLRGRSLRYLSPHDGKRGAGYGQFVRRMQGIVEQADAGYLGSPVYAQSRLAAPRLARDEGARPPAAAAGGPQPRCLVIQGFGKRLDARSGRTLDLDASFALLRAAVESAGCRCLRWDGGGLDEALVRALHAVEVVVADLSASVEEVLLQVGIRFALRPRGTLLVAEEQWPLPRAFSDPPVIRYRHLGEDVGSVEARRLRAELGAAIRASLAGATIDSPVYRALPDLQPPQWAGEPAGDEERDRLPEWASDGGKDEYGRWVSIRVADVTQRFRWIAPGTFEMGSPVDEPWRRDDEVPHQVTLTQGYWLADTACTQALWMAVMGSNPSRFQDDPRNPVEQVSWNDVQEFLEKLDRRVPGLDARLPSEAEWEYACRAGTTTAFSFGANITPEQVNYNGNHPYAGGKKGLYREKTVPVASLPANAWGLYEMHGNVWEWCADWYGDYPSTPQTDPHGAVTGDRRVLRGGSWFNDGRLVRSADRYCYVPGERNDDVGFRLAPGRGRPAEPAV